MTSNKKPSPLSLLNFSNAEIDLNFDNLLNKDIVENIFRQAKINVETAFGEKSKKLPQNWLERAIAVEMIEIVISQYPSSEQAATILKLLPKISTLNFWDVDA